MAKKTKEAKPCTERSSSAGEKKDESLEKFAVFFEQQNSKQSAKKLMWIGVSLIFLSVMFFVAYSANLQIKAFTWDQSTVNIKQGLEKQWAESFDKQEKEKNLTEIKKQMSEILQQIASSTVSTTSNDTSTSTLITAPTTTVSSTINTTSTKKK